MKQFLPLFLALFLCLGLFGQHNFATRTFDMSVIKGKYDDPHDKTKEDIPFITPGIELTVSSHYVSVPTYGDSRGAEGWRGTFGVKYYFDKEKIGGVALFELNYQRIGALGFFADHRIDDFNYIKTIGGTAGFGTNLKAADIFVTISLQKAVGDNISDSQPAIVELGFIGMLDIVHVFGVDIGVRGDFMYQATGVTSVRNRDISNLPFRASGGVSITKTL